MKTIIPIMKATGCWYIVLIAILIPETLLSQVAPYTVSPRWMVGRTSGMSFVQGDNSIGPPMNMTGNPAANGGQEATSTLCFPDKTIFLYCNNSQIYNVSNGLITTVNAGNGQSATQGAVTLPDPANPNRAYIFTGNDLTGGNQGGVNWYLIEKAGAAYTVVSGPNAVAATAAVNEGLAVSADGSGGYWVVSHNRVFSPTPHQYLAWHVTTGGVGATVFSASSCRGGSGAGGAIRFSKCQTKIALIGSQEVEVYNWNRTTGTTGALIGFSGIGNGPGSGYSGEFSPDGNLLYFAGLGGSLLQWNLSQTYAAGVVTITGTSNINGMTLGPDDKIYIAKQSTTISAINSPNSLGDACGYVANALTVTGLGPYLGLANEAWLNPNMPSIDYTINCLTVDFEPVFQTYFLDDITINSSTIEWNFGDGGGWLSGLGLTPSHVYPSSGTYPVQTRFYDATCTQQWTASTSVTLSCTPAPVTLLDFTGNYHHGQTDLNWNTTGEINNDYFEIERSDDGINFYTIGTVEASGNGSYDFTDPKECEGVTYYRLVQYDLDGTKTYSHLIQVKNDHSVIKVSPNPFTNQFMISYAGNKNSEIKILDVLGRVLETKNMTEQSYMIFMGEHLPAGTYIVTVSTEEKNHTYKMVKE